MAPDILLAAGTVFVAVAVLTALAAQLLLSGPSTAQKRLRSTGAPTPAPVLVQAPLVEGSDPALGRLARFIPKSPKEMSRLQRRLARAGYHNPWVTVAYALAELVLPVLAAVALWFSLRPPQRYILAPLGGFVAYMLPGFWLSWATERRKKRIANGLPDALDLLIVCVEAGLGLDQAIQKAGDELAIAHPALAEELRMITTEMRAGKPRMEAFRNFADRTKVEDVKSLVAMLAQTDRFGTSIAQALRTFAESSRIRRRQRAEERAAKLGVKLVFPLVFFLFPAMYVVTLGPAVIQFVRVFFPALRR
jgi:tight adherence protein C